MLKRLTQFSRSLSSSGLDSYIVTNDTNIRYLTGFPASESILIVFPTKSVYLTDSRYIEEVKKAVSGIEVEKFSHSMAKSIFEILTRNASRKPGFDDRNLSLNFFRQLQQNCPPKIKLIQANNLIENFRMVKEPAEVAAIRKCLKLNFQAYDFIRKQLKPGISEKQLLVKLEGFVKSRGAGFSFPPIIASGPNAAYPHALVSDRKLRKSEPVLIDMGIEINGYKSDLTRMFFLGRMTTLYKKIYSAVEASQQLAITKIRAGVKASDVDCAARNYLESLGLAKYFGHSLGHGVGLDIHEAPRLSAKSGEVLKEGMIVTVEPGVYLPGKFGIRLEEMVLVKKDGCEVLSKSHKVTRHINI